MEDEFLTKLSSGLTEAETDDLVEVVNYLIENPKHILAALRVAYYLGGKDTARYFEDIINNITNNRLSRIVQEVDYTFGR